MSKYRYYQSHDLLWYVQKRFCFIWFNEWFAVFDTEWGAQAYIESRMYREEVKRDEKIR